MSILRTSRVWLLGWSPVLGALGFGLVAATLTACTPKGTPAGPNAGKEGAAPPVGTLTWSHGEWPAPLRADPDWASAARGESWALLRLGERREALRAEIESGGPAAAVALRAWPLSSSAWAERGVLCRALPSYVAADWGPFLLALRESAATDTTFGEVLDPDAARDCERTMALLDGQAASMSAAVFDDFAATCQALGRPPPAAAL